MSLSTKILIFLGFVLFLCISGLILYKQFEASQRQDAIEKSIVEVKQLQDNIIRSQSQYASRADIEKYAKDVNVNMDVIKKDLDTLNAKISGINHITVNSTGQTGSGVGSDHTTPRTDPPNTPPDTTTTDFDPFGYLKNTQHLSLMEKFGETEVPMADVGFSSWMQKPWSYTVPERKYSVTNVIAHQEDGQSIVYNQFSINTNGKEYKIPVTDAKYLEQYPEAKFRLWNPRLFMTASAGVQVSQAPVRGEFTPGVSLGVMSYGKTTTNPSLYFGSVGIGYGLDSQKPQVTISPVMYNLGEHIPLIKNTYVGPEAQVGFNGNLGAGLTIQVGF